MISFETREKIEIITFTVNKINALLVDDIKPQINKVFNNPNSKVIINLKGVEYIDSSGFGCFLSALKAARSNYGMLKLASPEPQVMELFETLHLQTIFEIYPDLDKCIASFNNPPN